MKLNLMDYSLLLAVHDIDKAEEEGIQQESEDDVIEVRHKQRERHIFFTEK